MTPTGHDPGMLIDVPTVTTGDVDPFDFADSLVPGVPYILPVATGWTQVNDDELVRYQDTSSNTNIVGGWQLPNGDTLDTKFDGKFMTFTATVTSANKATVSCVFVAGRDGWYDPHLYERRRPADNLHWAATWERADVRVDVFWATEWRR